MAGGGTAPTAAVVVVVVVVVVLVSVLRIFPFFSCFSGAFLLFSVWGLPFELYTGYQV